jgi:hypothetical protein
MAQTIKLRRSATASAVPTTGQLALGELAINTYDGKLYLKKNVSGVETVVEVGGGGGASVTVSTTAPSTPAAGDLWWDSTYGKLKVYYTDANTSQWVDAFIGTAGADGTDGAAATISVGTVTTGAGGTSASVVNSGTSSAAVFDFTIPQGVGVESGGVAGDVLWKDSGTNYDTSWQPLGNKAREAVGSVSGQITGFVDRTSSTISFNESTRVATIAPVSGSFDVYYRGEKHTFSGSLTYTVPNTSGGRYLSIDPATWTLYDAGIYGDILNSVNCMYVYWDATGGTAVIFGDERHSVFGDPQWHYAQHRNVGTIWRSGGTLTYTLNDASAVSVGVSTPLVIADEDLEHTIVHAASPSANYEQILNTAASLPVMYKSGTTYVITTASTVPWVAGTSTARYNLISGGSGSLADAGEGKYLTYWLVATNSVTNPVRLIMGTTTNDTVDDAYAEVFDASGVPVAEVVGMYQIVLQTSTSYTANTPRVRIAAVRTISDRVASTNNAFSATSHDALTDRSNADQHPISAITNLQSSLDAKQATLVSGTSIKTVKSTSLLGSGDIPINEPPSGGTTGQVLTKNSATNYDYGWATPSTGGGSITNVEGLLAADVQLTANNTWYNGPSVTLGAGTWLVTCHLTHWRSTTTAETVYARISDGTNHHASTQYYHASVAGIGNNIAMTAILTLAGTTTIRGQMASSAGAATSLMKAALTANGAGNNASIITAIKVA